MSTPTPRMRALLQYAVVIAISGVLWWVLLDRLHALQEQSERTIMEATVRNMNSGLRFEIAARVIRGNEASLSQLIGTNPVVFLERFPPGYSGACSGAMPPGTWCYDLRTGEIAYRPRQDEHLAYPDDGRRELRWRIASTAEPAGAKPRAGTPVGAIALVSTTKFTWR